MSNISLKKLVEGTVNEGIFEPSDNIIKTAMAYFKQKTGIQTTTPTLKTKKNDFLLYEVPLENLLKKSPLLNTIFYNATLIIRVVSRGIGMYDFYYTLQCVPYGATKESKFDLGGVGLKDGKLNGTSGKLS